jgi:hypothetical protein
MLSIFSIGLLLANWAAAAPGSPGKSCRDFTVPVTVTSTNLIWGLPKLHTNFDATALSTDLGRWDSNVSFHPVSGIAPATAAYKISGTFCAPKKRGTGTVLLATHGFGFDRG